MIDIFLNFTNDELPINVAGANAPLMGGAVFSINVAAANAAKNVAISKATILKVITLKSYP
jgi:ABC-type arginine/histidine transport system permease subunit